MDLESVILQTTKSGRSPKAIKQTWKNQFCYNRSNLITDSRLNVVVVDVVVVAVVGISVDVVVVVLLLLLFSVL